MNKPNINSHQYLQGVKRILNGEPGLFEKITSHFHLDEARLAVLSALEERRINGEFEKKEGSEIKMAS